MLAKGRHALVLGAAGFLGSNLVRRLVNDGLVVTAVDSFERGCGGNEFNWQGIEGVVSFVRASIGDPAVANEVVKGKDYVFDLAGNGAHQASMREPVRDLELNTGIHLTLLEACRAHNPKAPVLFASTRQIYGAPDYLPVDEAHPVRPPDVNGINKLATEQHMALYARVYGMRTVSMRLTNAYGPRQWIQSPAHGFIGWFVNRALLKQPIELFGGGEQIRDFSYVDDTIEALIRVAGTDACLDGRALNVSGERASLVQVAEQLVTIAGSGTVIPVPFPKERKQIDIGNYYGSSAQLEALTGWTASVSLKEGLLRMFDYYRTYSSHYLSESTS